MDRHYLLVSDFDQTLSFHDSGHAMSERLGIPDFAEKVAGLSRMNLVQQGAELAYLLRHDPEFRRVLAAHGYTLAPGTGELAELAGYVGAFSAYPRWINWKGSCKACDPISSRVKHEYD